MNGFRWTARASALAVALVTASGCGSMAEGPAAPTAPAAPTPAAVRGSPAAPSPTPQVPATSKASSGAAPARLPAPDAPIPADPAGAARALARTTLALRAAIDAWTSGGGEDSWPPPHPVVLLSLYQQRMYRELAQDPAFSARVVARLPAGLARGASSAELGLALAAFAVKVLALATFLGVVESSYAKLRFFRVPQFLSLGLLCAFLALALRIL